MEGDTSIRLGYWNFRGRGQVLRHLLAYTGLKWDEKTYKSPGEWFGKNDRSLLQFDFPNLPYIIVGNFKLTESSAIAKYIARKSPKKELLGKNPQDQAKIDMVLSLLEDIFNPTYSLFFSPNHAKEKSRIFEGKVKAKLEELNFYIGDKDFTLGYLTLADFKIAEATNYFSMLYGEQFNKFVGLLRIQKNVQNLAEIKKYYASETAVAKPFLPDYAQLKF